jgi:hypothetical protein
MREPKIPLNRKKTLFLQQIKELQSIRTAKSNKQTNKSKNLMIRMDV